jgi:hypothetical protein
MPCTVSYEPTSAARPCERERAISSSERPPDANWWRSPSIAPSASPVFSVTTLAHATTCPGPRETEYRDAAP